MRTKTLLMLAAIGAAGIATSMAQVFSVNAVGYVNKTIPANTFAMVSNPLKAANNSISALFTGVPAGFAVYVYTPGKGYDITIFDDLENKFIPEATAAKELLPGGGVFVKNPSQNPVTITFVGEVMQGHLVTALVAGFQIVSSQVPQEGTAAALGLVGKPGDAIYQFDAATKQYSVSQFDDLENKWVPDLKPLAVADAFFLKKVAADQWVRDFNVNQP